MFKSDTWFAFLLSFAFFTLGGWVLYAQTTGGSSRRGDNLGNHIAVTNLNMTTNQINYVADPSTNLDAVNLQFMAAYVATNGDNLGNHIATQVLDMARFNITNANVIYGGTNAFDGVTIDTRGHPSNDITFFPGDDFQSFGTNGQVYLQSGPDATNHIISLITLSPDAADLTLRQGPFGAVIEGNVTPDSSGLEVGISNAAWRHFNGVASTNTIRFWGASTSPPQATVGADLDQTLHLGTAGGLRLNNSDPVTSIVQDISGCETDVVPTAFAVCAAISAATSAIPPGVGDNLGNHIMISNLLPNATASLDIGATNLLIDNLYLDTNSLYFDTNHMTASGTRPFWNGVDIIVRPDLDGITNSIVNISNTVDTILTNFVDLSTTQNNILGDKTWKGIHVFTNIVSFQTASQGTFQIRTFADYNLIQSTMDMIFGVGTDVDLLGTNTLGPTELNTSITFGPGATLSATITNYSTNSATTGDDQLWTVDAIIDHVGGEIAEVTNNLFSVSNTVDTILTNFVTLDTTQGFIYGLKGWRDPHTFFTNVLIKPTPTSSVTFGLPGQPDTVAFAINTIFSPSRTTLFNNNDVTFDDAATTTFEDGHQMTFDGDMDFGDATITNISTDSSDTGDDQIWTINAITSYVGNPLYSEIDGATNNELITSASTTTDSLVLVENGNWTNVVDLTSVVTSIVDTLGYLTNIDLGLGDLTNVNLGTQTDGDYLTFNGTEWTNESFTITNAAYVQLGNSTNIDLATNFADVYFDLTQESDTSILEHDPSNDDRILIKKDGTYVVSYSISVDANPGTAQMDIRARLNDTTEITRSRRTISEDDEINDVSNWMFFEASAGDYVTVQGQSSATGDTIYTNSCIVVAEYAVRQGPKGDTGAGSSVNVENDGVALSGGPHDTINFSTNLVAINIGGGTAEVYSTGGGGGDWWTNPPDSAITFPTNTHPGNWAAWASEDGTNVAWQEEVQVDGTNTGYLYSDGTGTNYVFQSPFIIGELSMENGNAQAITGAGGYQQITNWESNVSDTGYTLSHTGILVTVAGRYLIDVNLSYSPNSGADTEVQIFKNGAALTDGAGNTVGWERQIANANDEGSASASRTVTLAADDFIDIRMDTTGDETMTWLYGNLKVERR